MLHPSRHSFSSLASLSSFLSQLFPQHSTAAVTTNLANYSLISLVIVTTTFVIILTSVLLLATSRPPMPPRSKIPVAVTMPTKSPDKPKVSSAPGGLSSKETKKPLETTRSTLIKADDGQKQSLQTGEENQKNETETKSPSPSPTRMSMYLCISKSRGSHWELVY